MTPLEWIGFTHEEIVLKLSECFEILYFTKSITPLKVVNLMFVGFPMFEAHAKIIFVCWRHGEVPYMCCGCTDGSTQSLLCYSSLKVILNAHI